MAKVLRSKRLLVVLELARDDEDESARTLQKAREALGQSQEQLSQLHLYRQDYMQDINRKSGIQSVQNIINERRFLTQLEEVIQRQVMNVSNAEQEEARCLNRWKQAHLKRVNLEKLIEKYRHEEGLKADKALEKLMDELASQRWHSTHSMDQE